MTASDPVSPPSPADRRVTHGPSPDDTIAVAAVIRGKVQGVFFRASTLEQAQRLSLKGVVENRADGSVGLVAQGPRAKVEALLRFVHHASEAARVSRVQMKSIPLDETLVTFRIEGSGHIDGAGRSSGSS